MSATIILQSLAVVGLGNVLRGDDGAGARVCTILEGKLPKNVQLLICQQLNPEHAFELQQYDVVFVVDASVSATGICLYQLETQSFSISDISPSTHYQSVAQLALLGQLLQEKANTKFYMCEIPASVFEIGGAISTNTQAFCMQAAQMIEAEIGLILKASVAQ